MQGIESMMKQMQQGGQLPGGMGMAGMKTNSVSLPPLALAQLFCNIDYSATDSLAFLACPIRKLILCLKNFLHVTVYYRTGTNDEEEERKVSGLKALNAFSTISSVDCNFLLVIHFLR